MSEMCGECVTYLGQSQLNSPDLSLVSESVLSSELQVSYVLCPDVIQAKQSWVGLGVLYPFSKSPKFLQRPIADHCRLLVRLPYSVQTPVSKYARPTKSALPVYPPSEK